ncbi:MAG: sortase [Anaerolineaceae bacterium]|nr:sortase [Anaerolineaceae bacterium]
MMKEKKRSFILIISLSLLCISVIPALAAVFYANLEADIHSGSGGSYPQELTVYNGELIFSADDGTHGNEVWRFDGSTAELVEDFYVGASDAIEPDGGSLFVEYNDNLYFHCSDATGGRLCRYDGSDITAIDSSGVSPIVPIEPGPFSLAVYEGYLYFSGTASGGAVGRQLYRYSDSGTGSITQVSNIAGDGLNGFSPAWLAEYNGELYFQASGTAANGQDIYELWNCDICDGSDHTLAANINPADFSGSQPTKLTVYNNNLLFIAKDGTNGQELWSYNSGTGIATMVEDAVPGGGINPSGSAFDISESSKVFRSAVYNGVLYFMADDGSHGNELWDYDGTIASLVEDINAGAGSSTIEYPVSYGGEIYFTANDGSFAYDMLYSYDGSNASPAYDPGSPPWGVEPKHTVVYNGKLYASAVYAPTTNPADSSGRELVSFQVNPPEDDEVDTNDIDLPATGFAPDKITKLPVQTMEKQYSNLGSLWLEIPKLNIEAPIMGVPVGEDGWDLRWLSDQVGWLEGTAFPTWAGNSALTAHVYDANGQPGLFKDLGSLEWSDVIKIHFYSQEYTYEVRSVEEYIHPEDNSHVLTHEEFPWLTLITCQGYDPESDSYNWRIAVKAVQTEFE